RPRMCAPCWPRAGRAGSICHWSSVHLPPMRKPTVPAGAGATPRVSRSIGHNAANLDFHRKGTIMSVVTLAQASTIVDAALKKGRENNLAPLTVAVLDAGGHLVAFKREDKSGILRFDIAFGKAWGALGMGFGSRQLGARAAKQPAFFG